MFIMLMGILVAGILLGVLIISLSFLAQEGEKDKEGLESLLPAAADSYHKAPLGGIDPVNQAPLYLMRS